MNRRFYILLSVLMIVINISSQSRQVSTINNKWKFHKGDFNVDKKDAIIDMLVSDDLVWETLNIPNMWKNMNFY